DHVVLAQGRAAHALAAALLGAVLVLAGALDVAAARDRDDHVLLRDEVLHRHVAVEGEDLGPTVVAVLVDQLGELLGDDLPLAGGIGEDRGVLLDEGLEPVVLLDDLLALQGARRRSCIARMALAWISSISSRSISPVRASSTSGERRISAMTSSSASSALR